MLKAAPPAPGVPDDLRGRPVTYLGLCSTDLEASRKLTEDLRRAVSAPLVDRVGPTNAIDLGQIHLDPPDAVPALGEGRYLTAEAARATIDILAAGSISQDGPLNEIEIRHVAGPSTPSTDGALTVAPGAFLVHTGSSTDDQTRSAVERQLTTVRSAAADVDSGHSAAAFRDGQTTAYDALSRSAATRLSRLHTKRDPDRLLAPARLLTDPGDSARSLP